MSKHVQNEYLGLFSDKSGMAVIGGVAAAWVVLMCQFAPLTDLKVWFVPVMIIAVYAAFRLWEYLNFGTGAKTSKHLKAETVLTWKQLVLQGLLYSVLYFGTTGLLRGNVDDFSGWHSIIVAAVYFFAVPKLLRQFVWPRWPG